MRPRCALDAPFVEPPTEDGVSAVQLLAKIEARTPDKRLIHAIRDPAANYKGPDAREFLARPERQNPIQLPPHCPPLNPIERLWLSCTGTSHTTGIIQRRKQFARPIVKVFRETIPNEWKTFRSQISGNRPIDTSV
jgi:transposase